MFAEFDEQGRRTYRLRDNGRNWKT